MKKEEIHNALNRLLLIAKIKKETPQLVLFNSSKIIVVLLHKESSILMNIRSKDNCLKFPIPNQTFMNNMVKMITVSHIIDKEIGTSLDHILESLTIVCISTFVIQISCFVSKLLVLLLHVMKIKF